MSKIKLDEMVCRNLNDLAHVINHNTNVLARQIKRISKNRRHITILSGIVLGVAASMAYQKQKLEDQVYNLSVRVRKLEDSEEE